MNSITLKPELSELYTLTEFVSNELPQENIYINLIVEEVFVNIVDYSKADFVIVDVEYENSEVMLKFIDNGIEFNPLLKEDPKLSDNIDEAEIGGLGIYLTKELADELEYHYINGENHFKIIKKVEE